MTTAASSTPASLLKQETTPAHQRTEKALVARIKSIAGAEDYCSLLACLYGWFSPIEEQIDPVLEPLLADYSLRRKSSRLLADIRTLNVHFPLRIAKSGLPSLSPATALGYAYVLEGSVLGGVFIKKMIRDRFPAIPENAFSFFSGYGDSNRYMWNAFLEVLNRHLTETGQTGEAMVGANACFSGMERWIAEWK